MNTNFKFLPFACACTAIVCALAVVPAYAQDAAAPAAEPAKAVNAEAPPPAAVEPATPAAAVPAEPPKTETVDLQRFAITDLNQVDADYHDQGEYVGEIAMDGRQCPIGLQVVALGNGNFDALVYRGGLPGNGYDGSPRQKLSGSRTGEQVILKGEGLDIFLQTGYAGVVKTSSGTRLGFLQPTKRVSQTMGAKPPAGAIVLFDGANTDKLINASVTSEGLLEVGAETKDVFQNFTMHAEFRVPYMPHARGQNRGNSGFYLQRRYEVQVLDSFGLELQFNDCASLYRFKAPDLNMSFPPLRWQTYDIEFSGAQYSPCGQKICKARISVRHNGILVQNQLDLENKTGGGKPEGPNPLTILFQNHKNPVNFRNIWLVDHGQYSPSGCSATLSPVCCEVHGRSDRLGRRLLKCR